MFVFILWQLLKKLSTRGGSFALALTLVLLAQSAAIIINLIIKKQITLVLMIYDIMNIKQYWYYWNKSNIKK